MGINTGKYLYIFIIYILMIGREKNGSLGGVRSDTSTDQCRDKGRREDCSLSPTVHLST